MKQHFNKLINQTCLAALIIVGLITLSNNMSAQKCTSDNKSTEAECKKKIADIIWNGKLDEFKALVEKDKNIVNVKLKNNETPLTAASYKGDVEMVKYLLSNGAEVGCRNRWNNDAINNAAINGNVEIGKMLLDKGANIDSRGSYGYSPLQSALTNNKQEFAMMLIQRGANIDNKDDGGDPAIIQASWYANTGIVKTLIEKGADINSFTKEKYSVLHFISSNGNNELIDYLIQHGANTNLADDDGQYPLQIVLLNKNSDGVKLLAPKTANLNQKEKYLGNTFLHMAAVNGDLISTKYLIEAGADPNIMNNAGLRPADYAAKYGYVNLVSYYGSVKPEFANLTNVARTRLTEVNEVLPGNEIKVIYTGHSGWAMQLRDKVIIVDYWQAGKTNSDASLANGTINPDELKGKKVYVFVSHSHGDHYDTTIFSWGKSIPGIKYIYGFHPDKSWDGSNITYNGPAYSYFNDNQTGMIDDIKVTTIKSTDSGQGFLIEANGLKILHVGDHAMLNADLAADYKKEIDFLAEKTSKIDIAFIPVSGCPSGWKKEYVVQGFFYVIDKLNPAEVFPMHAYQREYALKEFAELAKQRKCDAKIICAEFAGDNYISGKPVTASN